MKKKPRGDERDFAREMTRDAGLIVSHSFRFMGGFAKKPGVIIHVHPRRRDPVRFPLVVPEILARCSAATDKKPNPEELEDSLVARNARSPNKNLPQFLNYLTSWSIKELCAVRSPENRDFLRIFF